MSNKLDCHIVRFDDIAPDEWDSFVESSPEAWFYHRHFWIANIESSYKQQKNLSFALKDKRGNILCVVGVFLNRGRFSVRKLITGTASGLAMAEHIGRIKRKQLYRLVDAELALLAKKESAISIQMKLPNEAPAWIEHNSYIGSHLESLGFNIGLKYGSTPYHTPAICSLILLNTDAEILSGFVGGRKTNLAESKVKGRRVVRPGDIPLDQAIDAFCEISSSVQRRTGLLPVPKSVLADILNHLQQMQKGGLYLVERDDGVFLSGVIVIHYKAVALNYLGLTRAEGEGGDKAGTLAMWEAMKNERLLGAKWFELGAYFPCLDHSDKMYLIGEFKRCFGGQKFLLLQGEKIVRPICAMIKEDVPRALYNSVLSLKKSITRKTQEINNTKN